MKLLMTKVSINYNICADCHDVESAQPSSNLADTGVCCACGSISNVWDIELLQLYRGVGISDEVIFRELPRLRCSHIPGTPKTSYSQIGQSIAASLQETVEDIAEVDANPEIIGQPPARGCWFITREEYDVVKRMIRGSYMPWYLLELPNGQWSALWVAGLQIENAGKILLDDYSGLAFTGTQDGPEVHSQRFNKAQG